MDPGDSSGQNTYNNANNPKNSKNPNNPKNNQNEITVFETESSLKSKHSSECLDEEIKQSSSGDLGDENNVEFDGGNKVEFEGEPNEIKKSGLHDIPDGGYGWLIVLACFLFNFSTWGANSGFAVYLSHYLNDNTFEGADKFDYALIGGLTFGTGLLFSPVINKIQGKVGLNVTAGIGVAFQLSSLLLASFAKKLWQLYVTQGILQAFGLAFMTIPAILIIPQWFKHKRTFASAISAAGSGCGGVLFNLAMQKVIQDLSVRWALRVQAMICAFLGLIATSLIRTRMNMKYSIYDKEVVQSAGFWMCALYLVLCMLGYVIVLYTMANVATSLGYSAYQGSIASALVQAGSVLGRPIVGRVSDIFGAVTVASTAYFVCGILVFAMWVNPIYTLVNLYIFCALMGALMGTVFATIPSINSKLYGLDKASVGLCLSWIFLAAAGIVSPVIGLSLKDGNDGFYDPGQYQHSAIFAGCAFFACSIVLLLMRGYIISRNEMALSDADNGHLHITVPIWAPIKFAFARRAKI